MVSQSWMSVALLVTASTTIATNEYTSQTATEGDSTTITFHLQKPIWPMTLYNPSNETRINWAAKDNCSQSSSDLRWIYNEQYSNDTRKTFLLLNVQQSDDGTWRLRSSSAVLAGVNIRVTKSSEICRSPQSTIPVLKCSDPGLQHRVMNGSSVRLFCHIGRPFSLEFSYLDNAHTWVDCAKNKQCLYNYPGIFLDPCTSNESNTSFIIPHVNTNHNGTWSFIFSSVKLAIKMEVVDTHCTDISSQAPVHDPNKQISGSTSTTPSWSDHPIPHMVLLGLTVCIAYCSLGAQFLM